MPRFGRLLFTLIAAASLLGCAATLVLGVHSYRVGRLAQWQSAWLENPLLIIQRRQLVGVSSGTFAYSIETYTDEQTDPLLASDAVQEWLDSTPERLRFDVFIPQPPRLANHRVVDLKLFRYGVRDRPNGREHVVLVPFWVVAPLLAVLPTWWLIRFRRHRILSRRADAGQCLQCGYDLRAQRPGDRCPECGLVNSQGA
jgi:hypothetical protein